jgi:hypothetical protein
MKTIELIPQKPPSCIYGIDFSGAQDAGKKIWIARGKIHNNILHIDICDLGDNRLLPCLENLQKFIYLEKNCVFGLDFPFGVQKDMVQRLFGAVKWEEFVNHFYEKYPIPTNSKMNVADFLINLN